MLKDHVVLGIELRASLLQNTSLTLESHSSLTVIFATGTFLKPFCRDALDINRASVPGTLASV